jgi:hypothetical protein
MFTIVNHIINSSIYAGWQTWYEIYNNAVLVWIFCVVFYALVSGHGSQLADVNGDEDGWDEFSYSFYLL